MIPCQQWSRHLVVGTLSTFVASEAVWAHHPLPRPAPGGNVPRPLLWFLGACVFGLVFAVTWAILAFSERRPRPPSSERTSSHR
jgi:hypothetical protein